MMRYFFHVEDSELFPDQDGVELPNLAAARLQGVRASGEAIKDLGARFWAGGHWRMEVTDDMGVVQFALRFSAEAATP